MLFRGKTAGCFQLYGSLDKTFMSANSDWNCSYLFNGNPTIKAIGIEYDGSAGVFNGALQVTFDSCRYLESCTVVDEQGIKHQMTLTAATNYGYAFNECTALSGSISLPATMLDGICYSFMFDDCPLVTELHYPKSIENDETFIAMHGSPCFGAKNATAYFDL